MAFVGFARVSTSDQDLSAQVIMLRANGCNEIFEGTQSGVSKSNEDKIEDLIKYIRKGDIVLVTKIDRLGRSLKSILKTIERIHEKNATLKSLDGAIDTSNESPFAKATISLLGTFAQLERDLIVARTSEGRKQAMEDGIAFGRPPSLSERDKAAVFKSYNKGKTMQDLALKFNVSRMTISRAIQEYKALSGKEKLK
ncbi:recombinase family protein [Alteromonas sp. MTD1]|uniref:recombinase family protein n=1 Tax=Alteromonas sp. MTD1 TaxID=3057962 RepID=UPI0036F2DC50